MPVTPTYPGVYIEEVSSGVRTIVGVATSIAAFIDFFKRGPINHAVQILNMGDFEREFGGLDTRSEASYSIQQFFLNGGTEAWVVRTAKGPTPAYRNLTDAGGGDVLKVTAGQRLQGKPVDNPGAWGESLFIDIDYATDDPNTQFNLTVSEIDIRNGQRLVVRSEVFRNLTMTSGANNALEVVNEASKLIQLSPQGTSSNRPAQTGTVGTPLSLTTGVKNDDILTIDYPGGSRDAKISSTSSNLQEVRSIVEAAIRQAGSNITLGMPVEPMLAEATVQLIGSQLRVLAGGRTNVNFNAAAQLSFSGQTATILGLAGATPNVQQYQAVGGGDGVPPEADELRGSLYDKTGLYALANVDIFNILCIPRVAELDDNAAMQAVLSDAISYCAERRAFLLVDIPSQIDTVQEAKDWLEQNATLRKPNAAVYFPRPRIADPLNGYRLKSVGASGTIAGLYARTDAERGVWKAPAGTDATLNNVQEFTYPLTDPENGTLNPLGINCLRTFPVYGNVSWGARTLVGADQMSSEWKYIPVRRLALFLEESLYRGLKWVVFEPNDEPLWAQIRLNVGAFMQNLFRQGAFQGTTPRQAYFVKCDRETTTQNDINLGIVNIVVGFAPLKPAEFVIIKLQQMAGQIAT